MIDHRRHAPIARCRSVAIGHEPNKAPALYRGAKTRGARDMFATDHAEPLREGRFRWLMSTCLAAAVGGISILVVIFGSAEKQEAEAGLMPALERLRASTEAPPLEAMLRHDDGLKWNVPKVDRLQTTSGAKSTRYVIHETLRQRRGGREYIYAKPYVRLVARLAPVPPNEADAIPAFNPLKLYADNKPIGEEEEDGTSAGGPATDISIRVEDLVSGVLPQEDGQSIADDEAAEIVERFLAANFGPAAEPPPELAETQTDAGAEPALDAVGQPPGEEPVPSHTTILAKTSEESGSNDIDILKPVVKTVREGQKLSQVLAEAGAATWQIREMLEAMKKVLPEKAVLPGQEVHIALQPSLTQNRLEPVRFSVFDEGHAHKVTVTRNASGEFVASADPVGNQGLARLAMSDSGAPQTSSLYAALYHASLAESVPSETIQQVLRIHAYETDFRRRLRSGDACEMFFDLKDEGGAEGPPGELLYTSIATGNEVRRYYRFRTPDGQVDYYDAHGSNAKKFLNRRPVRGDDIRLTSGFGLRRHPLLGEYKMHTGIDWAAPVGTPILAAGNGTIEEAGRKGYNGNYVRIRHANGYQTAYSHMSRFAPGAAPGVKVRQGQVIGYIGTTGLSSGPHLHFEVLVNNQFVNPATIEDQRERQLAAKDLADFTKERNRIDELMRSAPVLTASK